MLMSGSDVMSDSDEKVEECNSNQRLVVCSLIRSSKMFAYFLSRSQLNSHMIPNDLNALSGHSCNAFSPEFSRARMPSVAYLLVLSKKS